MGEKLLRQIAIIGDGGCFLRAFPEAGPCGGWRLAGKLILQFVHINTRAATLTFGLSKNGVRVCRNHHIYWKKQNPILHADLVRRFIGDERYDEIMRLAREKSRQSFTLWDWEKIELRWRQELGEYERFAIAEDRKS